MYFTMVLEESSSSRASTNIQADSLHLSDRARLLLGISELGSNLYFVAKCEQIFSVSSVSHYKDFRIADG